MTVGCFLELCCGADMLTVEIYSFKAENNVWIGCYDEIPDQYFGAEIISWDAPWESYHITLNID